MMGKKLSAAVLAAVLGMLAALGNPCESRAVFSEEDGVHIEPGEIPNSTLIIGTHLIYLGEMSDQIYETAMQSASDSEQRERYYKSELGGGGWYKISSASSLADITEEGKKVQDREIKELVMTHHTKSDGKTYELKTGRTVNAYDIESPYDLKEMSELSELAGEYETLQEGIGSDEEKENLSLLDTFFESKVETDGTKRYDKVLDQLFAVYLQAASEGDAAELKEMLDKAMEKTDNGRRYLVCQKVTELLGGLTEEMSEEGTGADLLEITAECMSQCESSADVLDGERLALDENSGEGTSGTAENTETAQGGSTGSSSGGSTGSGSGGGTGSGSGGGGTGSGSDTLAGQMKDELYRELVDRAAVADYAGCKETAGKLACLLAVTEGNSRDADAELKFLEETLLPAAQAAYEKNPGEETKNELEFFQKMQEKLAGGGEDGETTDKTAEKLKEQKESLSEERLAALDNQDLKEAKKLEAQIAEIDAEIQKAEEGDENPPSLQTDTEAVMEQAKEAAGTDLSGKMPKEDAQALLGLALLGDESGDGAIQEMAEGKAAELAGEEGGYVFPVFADDESKVPAEKAAAFGGLRYIWKNNKKEVILARAEKYYRFRASSDTVKREKDKTEKMEEEAVYFRGLYLPGSYVEENFGCKAVKIPGTGYAVLMDGEMQEKAQEICDSLL